MGKRTKAMAVAGCMRLPARLATSLSAVSGKIAILQELKRISSGTVLRYAAYDNGKESIIELSREHISVTVYSENSVEHIKTELALRLLAVVRLLWRDYSYDFERLIQHTIDAISEPNLRHYTYGMQHERENADLALSRRIIELLRENRALRSEVSEAGETARRVLLSIRTLKPEWSDPQSLANGIGIDLRVAEEAFQ